MRSLLSAAAFAALLVACSPPAQRDTQTRSSDPAPQVQACNDLTPDLARTVRIEDEMAIAAAASGLRGGAIAPGVYDLTRATRIGQPTGWRDARAAVLGVTEDANGVTTFNWASTPGGGGQTDRWTATFNDTGEHPVLTYTCGRIGAVASEFTAQPGQLTLRVPDGANGSLQMEFARRL